MSPNRIRLNIHSASLLALRGIEYLLHQPAGVLKLLMIRSGYFLGRGVIKYRFGCFPDRSGCLLDL